MSQKSNQLLDRYLDHIGAIGPDALAHYGVLGMKWGRRKDRSKGGKAGATTNATPSENKTSNAPKSNTLANNPQNVKLSTKQLQSKVNRLRMEKELEALTNRPVTEKSTTQQLQDRITEIRLQRELESLLAPPTQPVTPVSWQKQLVKSMPERLTKAAVDVSIGLGKKYLEQALKVQINNRVPDPFKVTKSGKD